jgi:hypothetical protein
VLWAEVRDEFRLAAYVMCAEQERVAGVPVGGLIEH